MSASRSHVPAQGSPLETAGDRDLHIEVRPVIGDAIASELERVQDPPPGIEQFAHELAAVLETAIRTRDVEVLERLHRYVRRRLSRRGWVRHVALSLQATTINGQPIPELLDELAEVLPLELSGYDGRALELERDAVREVLRRYRRGGPCTPAGVAARLAVMCGAFGYRSRRRARDAFKKMGGDGAFALRERAEGS